MKTKTSWKKGQTGNPNGAPKLPAIIKQIRELEKRELTEQFSEQLRMTKDKLKEVILNPKTPIKELGIAKGILKWMETGDFRYIQPYIEYIFGRPIQRNELTGANGKPIETHNMNLDMSKVTLETLLKLAALQNDKC